MERAWEKITSINILNIVIPNFGSHLGANWESTQINEYMTLKEAINMDIAWPVTRMTGSSYYHDWNTASSKRARYNVPISNNAHLQWIYDSYNLDLREDGPFGQLVRLVGTPAFAFFSLFEGDIDPKKIQGVKFEQQFKQ